MKTMRWILLAVIALGAAGWVLARAEVGEESVGDSDVRALRRQIEQLQARLQTLEDRLAKVESAKPGTVPRIEILPRLPGTPPTYPIPSLPGQFGRHPSQPKFWGGREINGWDFYVVPCGEK